MQMFELEDAPADETQMSEDDIEVINYALDWEPAALEALEAVPKPVLSLVVTATEEAVRNDGETLVTLKRFQELSEEYAPPEVLNHFSEPTDDSESITDSDGMRWMGSSHAMYEQAIAGTPRPFRSKTKKKLYEALEGRTQQDEVITEDMLIECVEEITPAGFAGLATKRLEPMRTKRGTP